MNLIKKNPSLFVGIGIVAIAFLLFMVLGGMKESPESGRKGGTPTSYFSFSL